MKSSDQDNAQDHIPAEDLGLYRVIFEGAAVGTAQVETATGRFLRVNRRFAEIVGYSCEELEQLNARTLVHPEDQPAEQANLRHLMAGEIREFTIEERYRRKDGSVIWVSLTVLPLWAPGERPSSHAAAVESITARKLALSALRLQAEKQLRGTAERLGLALKAANQGIYDLNVQTGEAQTSAEYATMLGYDPDGFRETNAAWIERMHPDDRAPVAAVYRDYIAGKIPEYRVEFRQRTRSGDWKWILSLGKVVERDAAGRAVRMLGTHTDITERRRAEEKLRALSARQHALLAALPDIVMEVNTLKVYTWANQPGLDFFGDDVIGREASCYFEGEQTTYDMVQPLFYGSEEVAYLESWQRRRDGEKRLLAWWCRVLKNEEGQVTGAISSARDITERKRAEEEREKLQAQLVQAQKMESIGRLAGGVAHDFNNMLQVILGRACLALEPPPRDSRLRENLQEIQRAAARSADLTQQLLAFARRQTIAPRVLDLNNAVAGTLKMLRHIIGEDIDVAWMPGASLWPVKVDPGQIDQILANLCINARDAIAGTGRVTIETDRVTFDHRFASAHPDCTPGDYVMIAVSDNGAGMDAVTQSHLFEPFFTTKGVGKGTGLGLATVFGIVRQNHGLIIVESELGRGSTFKIYLPRAEPESAAPEAEKARRSLRGIKTVLVVEDEEQVLSLSRGILEPLGYTVLTAPSPEAALALSGQHPGPIHLLITDVVMPVMNGKELRERLLAKHPRMKCLFISGYTADVIAHRGVLDEGVAFLQKPFLNQTLAARVKNVLSQKTPA